jgi:hypothetical protein
VSNPNDNLLEDVPDGITIKHRGSETLSFYTGRWEIELSKEEVMDLVDALERWLRKVTE